MIGALIVIGGLIAVIAIGAVVELLLDGCFPEELDDWVLALFYGAGAVVIIGGIVALAIWIDRLVTG